MQVPVYFAATLGNVERTLRAGTFSISECSYAPGASLAMHSHERSHLIYVLSGRICEGDDARSFECGTGSLFITRAGYGHWNRVGPAGCRSLAITIDDAAYERDGGPFRRLADFSMRESDDACRLCARIHAAIRSNDGPHDVDALTHELISLLAGDQHVRRIRRVQPWLHQARELLHERDGRSIGLTAMAAKVGVHPVHLARSFRQCFDCTIGEYLRRARIETAQHLLRDTDRPIAIIAAEAGFSDQAHLTRQMHRETGLTPAAFRRLTRPRLVYEVNSL